MEVTLEGGPHDGKVVDVASLNDRVAIPRQIGVTLVEGFPSDSVVFTLDIYRFHHQMSDGAIVFHLATD